MDVNEILAKLVSKINDYNGDEETGGYFDAIGREVNNDLKALGLPTIQLCYRFTASYSYRRNEINVYNPATNEVVFTLQGDDIPSYLSGISESELYRWLAENYYSEIHDLIGREE